MFGHGVILTVRTKVNHRKAFSKPLLHSFQVTDVTFGLCDHVTKLSRGANISLRYLCMMRTISLGFFEHSSSSSGLCRHNKVQFMFGRNRQSFVFVVFVGDSKSALASVSTFSDWKCNPTSISTAPSCMRSVFRLHAITGGLLVRSYFWYSYPILNRRTHLVKTFVHLDLNSIKLVLWTLLHSPCSCFIQR